MRGNRSKGRTGTSLNGRIVYCMPPAKYRDYIEQRIRDLRTRLPVLLAELPTALELRLSWHMELLDGRYITCAEKESGVQQCDELIAALQSNDTIPSAWYRVPTTMRVMRNRNVQSNSMTVRRRRRLAAVTV